MVDFRERGDWRFACPGTYVLTRLQVVNLGSVGVWWSATWRRADDGSADIAAELEDLGYSALWSSGGFEPGLAKRFEHLLSATARLTVADRKSTRLNSSHLGISY